MDETSGDGVEDVSAAGLVGVGRNERILRGAAANGDRTPILGGGAVVAASRRRRTSGRVILGRNVLATS